MDILKISMVTNSTCIENGFRERKEKDNRTTKGPISQQYSGAPLLITKHAYIILTPFNPTFI